MKTSLRIISVILLLFVAVSAFFGGWTLIMAPDGSKLQMPIELLDNTPFSSYLVPGIILFTVNGLLSLVTLMAVLSKRKIYPLLMIFQGMILCGWIISQISLIKSLSWLHLIYVGAGMLLFLLGLLLAFEERSGKATLKTI